MIHEFKVVITNIKDKKDSIPYYYTATANGYIAAVREVTEHAIKLLGLYDMQYYIESISSIK